MAGSQGGAWLGTGYYDNKLKSNMKGSMADSCMKEATASRVMITLVNYIVQMPNKFPMVIPSAYINDLSGNSVI